MYKHFPHRKDKVKTNHNIQEATTIEYIDIIYASLKDLQVECQSYMIEVEGEIINPIISRLIDFGANHYYIHPKIVDILHLEKSKLEKSILVQLATKIRRRINERVKSFPINMNGVGTIFYMIIIPLKCYGILIRMDCIENHNGVLDYHNNTFSCLDEEVKHSIVKGNSRPISIRDISLLQLKGCFGKGCKFYEILVLEPDYLPNSYACQRDCRIHNYFLPQP
jgi:hypothetical protein